MTSYNPNYFRKGLLPLLLLHLLQEKDMYGYPGSDLRDSFGKQYPVEALSNV